MAVSNSLGTARDWQRSGVKRPDNVIPFGAGCDREIATRTLPVPGGRDARLAGRVNVCKWLINVVKIDRRKVTDTPEPNGVSQVVSVHSGDTLPLRDRRKDHTHPRRVVQTELGKPDIAPSDFELLGREAARRTDAVAGRGGRRKRTPCCNGADTGLKQVWRRKSCPLPTGLHREMTGRTPKRTPDSASAGLVFSFNRRMVNRCPSGRVPTSLIKEDRMKVHPEFRVSASFRVPLNGS